MRSRRRRRASVRKRRVLCKAVARPVTRLLTSLPAARWPCCSAAPSRCKPMLAADKDRLIAGAKQTALQLRHKELDYYIERYSNLATQSSILAGFAFDALVELEIPDNGHWKYMEPVFYTAGSCTMACALYTLCVSSFAMVYGHRLALQGPTGSVERAVAVMMKSRTSIFVSFALAMFFLIVAASAMAWVKMGDAAAVVTGIFGLLFLILFCEHQRMKSAFRIDPEQMVQGDVRLQVGVTDVDISTLEAGFGGGGTAAAPPARGSSSHRDGLLGGAESRSDAAPPQPLASAQEPLIVNRET